LKTKKIRSAENESELPAGQHLELSMWCCAGFWHQSYYMKMAYLL